MTLLTKFVFGDSNKTTNKTTIKSVFKDRYTQVANLKVSDVRVVKYAIKNLLRLEGINLSLARLLTILHSQNKEERPTYNEILGKYREIVEKIELFYVKIPRESKLIPRLSKQSSIVDCSKDLNLRVESMELIFDERFLKKITKVGKLVNIYMDFIDNSEEKYNLPR